MTDYLIPLIVVIPLLLAPLCVVLRKPLYAWLLALGGSAFVFVMAVSLLFVSLDGTVLTYAFGGWQPPWGIAYRITTVHAWIVTLLGLIFTIVMVFSRKSIMHESPNCRFDVFFALCLLVLGGLVSVSISNDLFNIYVFLEVAALASYALTAFTHKGVSALNAFRYLIIGTIGSTLFLLGIGFLYFLTGTLNLSEMQGLLADAHQLQPVHVGMSLITVGLLLKAAVFPLHQWLPNAYTHAPIVISALLSASSTKVILFLWLRLFFEVFELSLLQSIPIDDILMAFAAAGILFGSFLAIRQNNIKTMFAYSSVAQIGYILMGFVLLSNQGLLAGLIYLWNHALIKAGLFLTLGCILYRCGGTNIENLKGLSQRMPLTAMLMVISGLALIGIPMTNGFISKWYLISALWEAEALWAILFVLLGSVLTIVYIWRLIEAMYFHSNEKNVLGKEAPALLLVPCITLTGLVLYFGIMPGGLIAISEIVANRLLP